jgi:PKD repeat protein
MRLPVRFFTKDRPMLFRSWFCLPFIFLFSFHGYAQTMVPEFTANVTSGCAPLTVSFKDLTTGSPKFWNWDFGNGTLANVQSPTVTYSMPGRYTVTMVVRNADGTNGITKTDYITVYASPSAGFDANIKIGCVPVNIQFADKSTSPVGNIVSWEWNFGDGATSTAQNPSHTYTNAGFYNVMLTVTSSTGCKHTNNATRFIRYQIPL